MKEQKFQTLEKNAYEDEDIENKNLQYVKKVTYGLAAIGKIVFFLHTIYEI